MTEENRPDPGLLLKKLQYEEKEKEKQTKGKLKIFLGYAVGSGKTYAMLEAAQRGKRPGGCSGQVISNRTHVRIHSNGRGAGKKFRPLWSIIAESSFVSLIWMRLERKPKLIPG